MYLIIILILSLATSVVSAYVPFYYTIAIYFCHNLFCVKRFLPFLGETGSEVGERRGQDRERSYKSKWKPEQ